MTRLAKRNSCLLLITAFIWGVAFVAQSTGGDALGPFTFNAVRNIIGGIVLLPVILVLDKLKLTKTSRKECETTSDLYKAGIFSGIALFAATNAQQFGIFLGCSAGKAGFLTAFYILLVPILGIFLKKKCGINVWIATIIALVGLYLLSINGSFKLSFTDTTLLLCALCFSIQIMIVDHYTVIVDGVRMACIQFFTCGVLSLIPTLFYDILYKSGSISVWLKGFTSLSGWISILYAGLLSCGVAYTLQIVGQQGLNPTIASLIMSLESVFSALAGWVILNQILKPKELLGCVLIFIAIIIAQINFPKKKSKTR